MIQLSFEKLKMNTFHEQGFRHTLNVTINENFVAHRFIDAYRIEQIPTEHIVEMLLQDTTNTLRAKIREQLDKALSSPVKQVWTN